MLVHQTVEIFNNEAHLSKLAPSVKDVRQRATYYYVSSPTIECRGLIPGRVSPEKP